MFSFTAIATMPFLGIFVYHYHVVAASCFLGGMSFFLSVGLWDSGRRLSAKPVILDRLQNQIIFDGHLQLALTDLRRVEVNRYFFRARKASCKMVQLRLVSVSGQEFTVQEGVTYTVEEAEVVGQTIADFAGVEFSFRSA